MQEKKLTVLTPGMRWPSGSYVEVAILALNADDISVMVGAPLLEGNEPGLGSWKSIGFELSSGVIIELIVYEGGAVEGAVLRVDAKQNVKEAYDGLVDLGISESIFIWKKP